MNLFDILCNIASDSNENLKNHPQEIYSKSTSGDESRNALGSVDLGDVMDKLIGETSGERAAKWLQRVQEKMGKHKSVEMARNRILK